MSLDAVQLGDITFDGSDSKGWIFQSLDAWHSLPESKAEISERPKAHGAFDVGTDWRQSAAFVLTVAYLSDSYTETVAAIRALTGLAQTDALITMSVSEESVVTTRQVSIRRIDVPDLHDATSVGSIAIDLLAPDPVAYGVESSVSTGLPAPGGGVAFPVGFPVGFGAAGVDGRARFTNDGTAPAPVRFRVSGGLPDGFSLRCVETGDALTFRRPVASDDYVLLDSSDGSALLNGVSPVSGYLTDDDWWQVGPGETCTVQFTSLGGVQGSPLLVLSGSPAYF
ncbi:phage tail domain-containing protein [Bifidobacterium crudilactis]|uniref:phage tail domain-containing protein n=2 Tax=Bifidobacterium crudilactis TaxID=327277 RepID=UPI002649C0AC|nr:phage tail domain-containing protein [Bifidobacterium crudilactis]MDN6559586.1 phage tail family protein [Bifidobacterium crudilactis]MDN6805490.1 phage tail family protein [Bifidobacterium crudilactis]MDN6817239.1 phage tail family protein [Bifidobacterium crudilactis]